MSAVKWAGASGGSSLPQAGVSFPGTQADIGLTTRGPEARHKAVAAKREAGGQERPAERQLC